jgi:hypothetical protein
MVLFVNLSHARNRLPPAGTLTGLRVTVTNVVEVVVRCGDDANNPEFASTEMAWHPTGTGKPESVWAEKVTVFDPALSTGSAISQRGFEPQTPRPGPTTAP